MDNLKLPLSSVKVPASDPLTVMDTAETLSLLTRLTMEPEMVEFCAKAALHTTFASTNVHR